MSVQVVTREELKLMIPN